MIRRALLVFTLALLVGLGQQGAAWHALSHLADSTPGQHHPEKGSHGSTCDKCVAYAALAGTISSHHVSPLLIQPHAVWQTFQHTERTALAAYAYHARAPPSLV